MKTHSLKIGRVLIWGPPFWDLLQTYRATLQALLPMWFLLKRWCIETMHWLFALRQFRRKIRERWVNLSGSRTDPQIWVRQVPRAKLCTLCAKLANPTNSFRWASMKCWTRSGAPSSFHTRSATCKERQTLELTSKLTTNLRQSMLCSRLSLKLFQNQIAKFSTKIKLSLLDNSPKKTESKS